MFIATMPNTTDIQPKSNESKLNKKNIIRYAVCLAAGLLFVLAVVSIENIYAQTQAKEVMRILSDGFFVSGICFAGVGLLIFASNGGAFDILGYGFRMVFEVFRRDLSKRKYKDYYEYRKAKREKPRSVAYVLIVGIALILIAVIFTVIYYNV